MADQTSPDQATAELARMLVRPTVLNALRIPFYQDLWRDCHTSSISTPQDLHLLPPLTKADLEQFAETFEYEEVPEYIRHTSRTTGDITFRCTSATDARRVWDFYASLLDDTEERDRIPLTLCVESSKHGATIPMPGNCHVLRASGFSPEIAGHVIEMLLRSYRFPCVESHVSTLICGTGFLKLLHVELMQQGISPTELNVRTASVTGDHLEPRWRDLIEERWQLQIVNRYSISEVFGGAVESPASGLLRFDPIVIPEIVDPWTMTPVADGPGLLLLTELYPFSMFQPAIRYVTGDLMESVRVPDDAPDRASGYRFLGRWDDTVKRDATQECLVYPARLAEALEGLPMLCRSSQWKTLTLSNDNADLGPVIGDARLLQADDTDRLVIRVCPRFSTSCFPDTSAALTKQVRDAVMVACPGLHDESAPEIAVELANPDDVRGRIFAN